MGLRMEALMSFSIPPAVAASSFPPSGLTPTARVEAANARGKHSLCEDTGLERRWCFCDWCDRLAQVRR